MDNKQGPDGDRVSNSLKNTVEDEGRKFYFNSNANQVSGVTCLEKRDSSNVGLNIDMGKASVIFQDKRNSSNVRLEENIGKHSSIQEPVNVKPANRNQNVRYVYSKLNTNNARSTRKPLINVISTLRTVPVKAQNNSFINRPPFKM